MNIDDLTIGQVKQIAALNIVAPDKSDMLQEYIGKYVICRTRNEGINAGIVKKIDETGVVLTDARRIWYHKPIKGSWYEAIANNGISSDSKISEPVEKVIIEDYSLTICTDKAIKSISQLKSHES